MLPGQRPVDWHMGGLYVTPKGELAVTCYIREQAKERNPRERIMGEHATAPKVYTPRLYPGRAESWVIHIWDKHGRLQMDDAVQGLPGADGVALDHDLNVYAMVRAPRVLGGKPYFDGFSQTLMKFKARQGKFISSTEHAPVPLHPDQKPKRAPDVTRGGIGATWVEGAEWIYGGVGYGGQGGSCVCWYARWAFDGLHRSFVPETDHFTVAVLDAAGNLILRLGRYGNVDSAGPQSRVPLGGDEVGLFHPNYLAVHTDRRLFIHDGGNMRIVSVKLDYHAEEQVPLRSVPDAGKAVTP